MKPWKIVLIILGIIVVGDLLLTFLLLHKSSTTPAPVQTAQNGFATTTQNVSTSPMVFTTNFYSWYLAKRAADVTFPASTNLSTSLGPWLTPNFISNWNSIGDQSDADPVLFAQDIPSTWNTVAPQGTILTITDTASSVKVVLGAGTTQAQTYTVSLLKVNGAWRIDSVTSTY